MPPVPTVQIKKSSFGAGGASPGTIGIAAIIAAASTGTQNQISAYYQDGPAFTVFGDGPLVQYASYDMQQSGNAAVLCRATAATAGAYLRLATTGGGTSVVTTDGSVLPADKYSNVTITIVNPGTIGVSGITYTYSLDGVTTSALQALGTATSITLPNGAGKVNFAAGTVLAGQVTTFDTERPLVTNTDLPASFTALQNTRIPWEGVLIDCVYASGTVGLIDTWLTGLEAQGQFHFAIINTRMKTRPTPSGETEAAYLTAMTALVGSDATDRVCVGTDGADYTSTMHGWSQERPTAMFLMARAMAIPVGTDPSYIAIGAVGGATLADGSGNPRHHDEDLFPGLDALRLSSMRGFANPGPQGAYFTNANMLSVQPGSSYVWLQHLRCMNLACSIAWSSLVTQLSRGVNKKPADKVTGGVYIADADKQAIEGIVNPPVQSALKNQVAAVQFSLSPTDDLSNNTSSTINATLQMVALAYAKKFVVTSVFVKTITAPLP